MGAAAFRRSEDATSSRLFAFISFSSPYRRNPLTRLLSPKLIRSFSNVFNGWVLVSLAICSLFRRKG